MPPLPSAAVVSSYPLTALVDDIRAAAILGVKPQTLRKWRCVGGGPRYVKVGTAVRYDPADLQAFIEAGRRTSTSDTGEAA